MKERPIIFSGPMVRAILEGRKTQTRRVTSKAPLLGFWQPLSNGKWEWCADGGFDQGVFTFDCPYGIPGDRLWVRESFQPLLADGVKWADSDYETGAGYAINYTATSPAKEYFDCRNDEAFCDKITPSIFMKRWASRITLEITDVRVQRVQEISEEDAIAEGCEQCKLTADYIADIQISDADPHIKELARLLGAGTITAYGKYQ